MSIHLKLILLPLFIGLLILSVEGVSIYSINHYLNALTQDEQIKKNALYEIEININEAAAEVTLISNNHSLLEESESRFIAAEEDFEQAYRQFANLSGPDTSNHSQLRTLSEAFFEQGKHIFKDAHTLLNLIQERRRLFNEGFEVQIDEIIQPLAIKNTDNNRSLKQQAAFEIEVNMNELMSAVRGYLLKQDAFLLDRIEDSKNDLQHWLQVYQQQALNKLEKVTIEEIVRESESIFSLSQSIIGVKQKLLQEHNFSTQLYRQIDALLDDNLQVSQAMNFNHTLDKFDRVITAYSIFLALMIIVSMFIVRRATFPILKDIEALRQSTRLFQKDQVINLPKATHDELGELNQGLERMMLSLKANTTQLEKMATYDMLTGLPNRILLADRLDLAIAENTRNRKNIAVLFIDLDGFKRVNDTFGHGVGDKLLVSVATDLKNQLRHRDGLYRIRGDEFIALLPHGHSQQDLTVLLTKLIATVSKQRMIDGNNINVSASIGVYMVMPGHQDDTDEAIRKADIAMYQAKISGKNQFYSFNTADNW